MPKLSIFVPDADPIKFGFSDADEVTVGRAADNDIVLTHDSISGHHAKITHQGGQWVLADLGSTNGTFLEGAPAENAVLGATASIVFGQVDATFEDEEAAAATPETPAAAPAETAAAAGGGFSSSVTAAAAEDSNRPADFKNLSPLEAVSQKDVAGQVTILVGVLGILVAIAAIGLTFMMKAP